jgi:hypothetical protein
MGDASFASGDPAPRGDVPGAGRSAVYAAVLALVLAGCAAQPAAPLMSRAPVQEPNARPTGSEDDEVRLAVYRHLVHHNASGGQLRVPFVCLEIDQGGHPRDPSPFIMSAMRGSPVRVVPGSACESSARGVFLKADRAAGEGLVFRTEDVEIVGDKAKVTGGYFEAGLSASGNVYSLERQPDGSWRVTHDEMQWISGTPRPPRAAGMQRGGQRGGGSLTSIQYRPSRVTASENWRKSTGLRT